jgi:hypothetical protein
MLKDALPAIAAHFDDPVPGPDLNLIHNAYHLRTDGWQGWVFAYVEFAGLTLPPNLISPAIRALDGPNSGAAMEQLEKLKPLPPDVLRALIGKFQRADIADKAQVITSLSRAGVTGPEFVDLVLGSLYSTHRELLGVAVSAAWKLGPAVRSALPILQKIAATHPFNDETKSTAQMLAEDIQKGISRSALGRNNPTREKAKATAEAKVADPASMRLAEYLAFLKTVGPEERRKLLADDVHKRPFERTLVPAEDLPLLIEILNGNDPDFAASAAGHLVVMALRNRGAGTKVRELIATALPALAAHYDDPLPPVAIGPDKKPTGRPTMWNEAVMTFIWQTGANPPPSLVPKIVLALQQDAMAMCATQALAQLKPMLDAVLNAVLQKMRTSSWDLRDGIIQSLAGNGVNNPAFVLELAANLQSPDGHHQEAARALSWIGAAARPAEAALRQFLSKEAPSGSEEAGAQFYARLALKNLSVNYAANGGVVGTGRFELPTCRLGGDRSIHLSYVPSVLPLYSPANPFPPISVR